MYETRFMNRRGINERIESNTLKQAIAVGRSWAKSGTFKVYKDKELVCMWVNDKPLTFNID